MVVALAILLVCATMFFIYTILSSVERRLEHRERATPSKLDSEQLRRPG
jgi:hypothetical protein